MVNKKFNQLPIGNEPTPSPSSNPESSNNSQSPSASVLPKTIDEPDHYSISGMISGISGTIILQNNNKDDLTIDAGDDSVFTFHATLTSGQAYNVTVKDKPANHVCYVYGGAGVVNGTNVNNIKIACGVSLSSNPFTSNPVGGGGVTTYTLVYTAALTVL